MTQDLSPRERGIVARFGVHDAEMTPAARCRFNGWAPGTRLHGGPVRDRCAECSRIRARAQQARLRAERGRA